jgi:Fe-Mn family superoxide dismutase
MRASAPGFAARWHRQEEVMTGTAYRPQDVHLSGLSGISDRTLAMHIDLYRGYVRHTNLLTEQLAEMREKGRARAANPAYAELTRRLGFEYGGMVLHEYYFGNLAPKGRGEISAPLRHALEQSFGGFEAWKADFAAVGSLRGVGWAILYEDPANKRLSNHWIALHQQGVPAGFKPLLVMDVWEHAYLLDYPPADRGKYIDAFFGNTDWTVVNARLASPAADRLVRHAA